MRRALTWLAGAVGLAALARLRARRHAAAPAQVLVEEDPADELRRKLADQREDEPAGDDADVTADPVDLDARRAEVHQRAQEAIDLMRENDADLDGPDDDSVA